MKGTINRGASFVALCTALMMAAPAYAQVAVAEPEDNEQAEPQSGNEIIVTAQKRSERLQDVPISVTALGEAELNERGAVDFDRYIRSIPGAQFSEQGAQGNEVKLRGVGSGTSQLSPTTAIYFGEVPVIHTGRAVNSSYNFRLVDIGRVEVLRGPQGTLYGSNSLGGAIKNIPNRAEIGEFGLSASVSGSKTRFAEGLNYDADVTVNIPVGDQLALRATGYVFEQKGWFENVYAGGPALGSLAIFFPPVGPPSAAIGRVPGSLLTRIIALDPAVAGYRSPAVDESNNQRVHGARLVTTWEPSDGFSADLILAYERKETDGPLWAKQIENVPGSRPGTVAGPPFPTPYPSNARRFEYSDAAPITNSDEILLANLVLNYDLGPATLTSSTSYWDRTEQIDTDIGPLSFLVTGVADTFPVLVERSDNPKSFTQEVRIASQGNGPLNYLVGLFYQKIDQDFTFDGNDLSGLDLLYLERVARCQLPIPNPTARPPRLNAPPGPCPTTRELGLQRSKFVDKQYAVFGEIGYDITPQLNASVSFRYFKLKQHFRSETEGFQFVLQGVDERRNKDTIFTPRFNVSFKPDDDKLFYATASKGFRTGIINRRVPLPLCQAALNNLGFPEGVPPTKADTVWNYELGAKLQLDDRRLTLNGAVYQVNWKDLQSQVFLQSLDPARQCTSDQIVNVGDARIRGLELESNLRLTKDLTLIGAFALNDPKYKNDIPGLNIQRGQTIEGTPDFTSYLALRYGFDLGGRRSFFRTEWVYTGEIKTRGVDFIARPAPFPTGDFHEVNMRFGTEVMENVNLDVWATNLFDAFGVTRQTDIGGGAPPTIFPIRPRTIGATLRGSF